MGFLDSLRDKFSKNDDDYYDDDEYYDDEPQQRSSGRRDPGSAPRLLDNPSRPEAESVSVYTRSGRPVTSNPAADYAPTPQPSARDSYASQDTGYAPSYERRYADTTRSMDPMDAAPAPRRVTSGQLPPYVLRPVSYDDVQMVVHRVRTNQPVVLVFRNTNIETAKRIFDFSLGFAAGVNGSVDALGDKVFVVLPEGISLSQSDVDKLVADGDLVR